LAGLVANTLVSSFSLGPIAPFDATSCLLAVGMDIIIYTRPENYGDPSKSKTIVAQFQQAASAITSGKAALFCDSYWLGLLLQDVVNLSIFGFFQRILRLWSVL
jgi:hypothetical protein